MKQREVRLRVLRVIARMNVGGPAIQASILATGLDPVRFESLLLAGVVGGDEADFTDLRANEVPFQRVAGLGRAVRPLDDGRAFRAIAAAIRRFQPHIVHTHTAKAGVLGRVAAMTLRVPFRVHTFHGHLLQGYFSRGRTRAIIQAERALAHVSTRIVAVGDHVRNDLLAAGIGRPEQYAVIAPGVELPRLPGQREARELLNVPSNTPVVAYVGRVIPVKRPDRFVEMATRLGARHPDATFIVVGGGSLLTEFEAQAHALGDRIRFLGWRPDVETVYAAADAVVLTSDNEGMPISLIEAALAGRPAVTTAAGSASEVVVDGVTGFVTARSATALAEAVGLLLDESALRDRMGSAGRARAQKKFSSGRLVRDTEELYETMVAETS
jgi:glycosyltransferase involved in cell wall biosynthesis